MKQLALLLVAILPTFGAMAQDTSKFTEYMDASVKVDHFSGTVLVASKGEVVFQHAYGLASLKDNTPNTTSTVYPIGSMSKPITATAIMLLRDQGRLRLEDSICVYLAPCPPAWKPVTLQHLLTHTSGLPDVVKFPDYMTFRAKRHTPQQLVELIASRPVDFAPGTKFVYCNSNFILLGAIVEKVSGKPYQTFLQQNIFAPVGMKSSGYEAKSLAPEAVGYIRDGAN